MNEKEIIDRMFPKVIATVHKITNGHFKNYEEIMNHIDNIFTNTEKTFLAMSNILKFIEFYNNQQVKESEIQKIYI